MTDRKSPPKAGPKTQSAAKGRGGGPYGQEDFSQSARRSRQHTERQPADLRSTENSDTPGDLPVTGPGSL